MLIHNTFGSTSSFGTLQSAFHTDDTSSAFAADMRKRITQTAKTSDTGAPEGVDASAAEAKSAMLDKLEASMGETVSYVAKKYGDQAATAMMGIMYKSLGDGAVTEESLGEAYLDVTRFIDKNFGIESGDDFMVHLNGQLNDSLNEYFDNGQTEQFMAITADSAGDASAMAAAGTASGTLQDGMEQVAEQQTKHILAILEQARNEQTSSSKPYAGGKDDSALQGVLAHVTV